MCELCCFCSPQCVIPVGMNRLLCFPDQPDVLRHWQQQCLLAHNSVLSSPSWICPFFPTPPYQSLSAIYHYASFGAWSKAGFVFTGVMYYLSYRGVVGAAAMGLGSTGYWFDLLALTAATQLVCLFTDKGWYIYLLVSHGERGSVV